MLAADPDYQAALEDPQLCQRFEQQLRCRVFSPSDCLPYHMKICAGGLASVQACQLLHGMHTLLTWQSGSGQQYQADITPLGAGGGTRRLSIKLC